MEEMNDQELYERAKRHENIQVAMIIIGIVVSVTIICFVVCYYRNMELQRGDTAQPHKETLLEKLTK